MLLKLRLAHSLAKEIFSFGITGLAWHFGARNSSGPRDPEIGKSGWMVFVGKTKSKWRGAGKRAGEEDGINGGIVGLCVCVGQTTASLPLWAPQAPQSPISCDPIFHSSPLPWPRPYPLLQHKTSSTTTHQALPVVLCCRGSRIPVGALFL